MSDNDLRDGNEAPEPLGLDLIIPGLGSALAVYFLVSTSDLAWEARATGSTIGFILLVLCSMHLVRSVLRYRRGKGNFGFGEFFADTAYNRQRLILLVLLSLFVATIKWLGVTLGLFLLMFAAMLVMGVREPKKLFGIAFATAATVYVAFIHLLNSRLPKGWLENLMATVLPPLGG